MRLCDILLVLWQMFERYGPAPFPCFSTVFMSVVDEHACPVGMPFVSCLTRFWQTLTAGSYYALRFILH